jgi:hypothetical protein
MLCLLIVAAVAATWVSASILLDARARAFAAADDLRVVQTQLADLAAAGGAEPSLSAQGAAGRGAADPELNRRLRDAASFAGAGGQLASIEPSEPRPLEGSDRAELLLFLHFDRATLRSVVTFLKRLSSTAPGVRPASIELAADAGAGPAATPSPGDSAETWLVDLTLSYEVLLPPKGTRATPE